MKTGTLLIEIGCEEIPARMIPGAARELRARVIDILDRAGLAHGGGVAWGGTRRLAVRVEEVEGRQPDRQELITGPPADVAFDGDGRPTRAAEGFARKQGIDPASLQRIETDRGSYVGFRREVGGLRLAEVLASALPAAVEGMPFPKSMRWGDGRPRWVRPVHWVLALHGSEPLALELFGIEAAAHSFGHRFLSAGRVEVLDADAYVDTLREAHVIVDPDERRGILGSKLRQAASDRGGQLLEDPALLDEIADLVEWPGVVVGEFDRTFLDLPREILVTTLRYHQKCFSVVNGDRRPMPVFLAVSNTDRDPAGHVRRGNEWVVGGRLEDARFFWSEDRKQALGQRSGELERVSFHREAGSYADKAGRVRELARAIAGRAGLGADAVAAAARAAELCKVDLTTGTVGEFPELQGVVGGLLLEHEGEDAAVARAVYEHYRPEGPEDELPVSETGCVVSLADKLDSVASLVAAGEVPSGSRDPFALRRAANGVLRVAIEKGWPLSLAELCRLAEADPHGGPLRDFLAERAENFLRDRGYTGNEVRAVLQAGGEGDWTDWTLPDVRARLEAITTVRGREDFRHLVELTRRVANILRKNADVLEAALAGKDDFEDPEPVVAHVEGILSTLHPEIESRSRDRDYGGVIDLLATLVQPVDAFFERALVIDPDNARSTAHRLRLLNELDDVLTRYFDITELSGEAETRRG